MQHLTRSQRQMALALQQGGVHRVYVPPPPRHPGRALKRIAEGIVFVAGAVGLLALLALVAGYGGA